MPMTGRCREPNCHAVVIRPLHYCTKHADKEAAYQASRERWTNRTDNIKRYKDYNKRKREYSDIKVEQNLEFNINTYHISTRLRIVTYINTGYPRFFVIEGSTICLLYTSRCV